MVGGQEPITKLDFSNHVAGLDIIFSFKPQQDNDQRTSPRTRGSDQNSSHRAATL